MGRVLTHGVIAVAALSAVVPLPGGPTAAAAKRSCQLVTDSRGDTSQQGVVPTDEPALDILSADVATDAEWLTVAVRVVKLDIPESGVPPMRRWSVLLTTGDGVRYIVQARQGHGGTAGDVSVVDGDEDGVWTQTPVQAQVRVHLDTVRAEVRISLRRGELGDSGGLRPGKRISGLRAVSWHENTLAVPVLKLAGEWDGADDARSERSYVAGSPSCLKPGS